MIKKKVIKLDNLEDKQLVVKSNKLIEASYRLSVQEQRIILLIASMIKPSDSDFETYRIDIKDFIELIGVKGHSKYEEIKDITKKLIERSILIKDIEQNTELQVSWVSSFKYYIKKGYVQICFDPQLKPYLLQLKERFTKYNLRNVMSLRSGHSIRMYELLKQYENIGQRELTISELKTILGIKKNEYKQYGHLKSRILNGAKKELVEKTDIYFEYQELKQSKKVKKIMFYIYKNKDNKIQPKIRLPKQLPPTDINNTVLYNRLIDYFLLSSSQAADILRKYEEKRIVDNLEYVEKKYRSGEIENLGAYTLRAIEDNYHVQTSLFDYEKQQKEKTERERKLREQIEAQLKAEYENKILAYKESLSPGQLKKLEEKAQREIENDPKMEDYKKFGADRLYLRLALDALIIKEAKLPELDKWKEEKMKNHPALKQ